MSASLQIACPNCSKSYRISNEFIGKVVRCRSCELSFKIDPENPSLMAAPKPSPTEINAVPPPLPSIKLKTNKKFVFIALSVLLLILVGGEFWLAAKSSSQNINAENAIKKEIITEFEQNVSNASRKPAEPRIDQRKQNELDWIAITRNPPLKRYDVIEYKDIKAEEHRFVMTSKIDEANLERYAEEYATKYGSNLDAIELRFYTKENRFKYRGEKTEHLGELDDIIEYLKILDEISVDLLACCKMEIGVKDGKPLFVHAPFKVPKQSLLVLRHVLRQRTLDAEKGLEKISGELEEFDRKSKEIEEKRRKNRTNSKSN